MYRLQVRHRGRDEDQGESIFNGNGPPFSSFSKDASMSGNCSPGLPGMPSCRDPKDKVDKRYEISRQYFEVGQK